MNNSFLQCVRCAKNYSDKEIRYRCDCGSLLEVRYKKKVPIKKKIFDVRLSSKKFPLQSGVWRYKELLPNINPSSIISRIEGNTHLYSVGKNISSGFRHIGEYVGLSRLFLKHEGENPTGSFKDRGMTVGISKAVSLHAKAVACASTGNTSASLASYAAQAELRCLVFIPDGKITLSKLAQSIAYGAKVLQIKGDFDQAMQLVEEICRKENIYLLNSINPFRIEGQKTIGFELLQQLGWKVPDWIVLPGGNLGNVSAIGKGLFEMKALGIIRSLPRIAVIQAHGANPFYVSYKNNFSDLKKVKADTVASAIRIGNPVSFIKAKHIIQITKGIVEEVTDVEILDAKAVIDSVGIGCEPASAATVAGIKKLVRKKIIKKDETVCGILTGSILKDPETIISYHKGKNKFSNAIKSVASTYEEIKKFL